MSHAHRLVVVQTTLANYCKDMIDRPQAQRILVDAGLSADGAAAILDSADKNLTLKKSYKANG